MNTPGRRIAGGQGDASSSSSTAGTDQAGLTLGSSQGVSAEMLMNSGPDGIWLSWGDRESRAALSDQCPTRPSGARSIKKVTLTSPVKGLINISI